MKPFIGTAGWAVPRQLIPYFGDQGSHLDRYAKVFNCVEINSSFYRDHRPETYLRWSEAVSEDFRFSVKLSRYFTQEARLTDSRRLPEWIEGVSGLGKKWRVLLVQLPPNLRFDFQTASRFISRLRLVYSGAVVWEPRHKTWGSREAVELLADFEINKAIADPERVPLKPEFKPLIQKLRYLRLHGSPEIYKSRYTRELIEKVAGSFRADTARENWCIFDNTTFGYATENAVELLDALRSPGSTEHPESPNNSR